MKYFWLTAIAALVAAWALALPHSAKAEDAEVAAMMNEIQNLTTEKENNNKQIKIDLQTFQQSTREDESKRAEVSRAKTALDDLQRQGRALQSQYGGSGHKIACNKGGKTIAACESRRLAINAKIAENSAKIKAASANSAARGEKAKSVADKQRRNREIDNRIALLRKRIAFKKANESNTCRKQCTSLTSDAAAQCLQCCWDRARCSGLSNVEQVRKPVFSMVPQSAAPVVVPAQTRRRTAQEAIDEYKKSGAQRPGPGFHMRDVPPPKF